MKISKLFHWLYAVLMFLPIFMFLPTGLYYAFNDNAENVNYIETPIYQTNEVNSKNDIVLGNVYHCTEVNFYQEFLEEYQFKMYILQCNYIDFTCDTTDFDFDLNLFVSSNAYQISFTFDNLTADGYFHFSTDEGNTYFYAYYEMLDITFNDFDFYLIDNGSIDCLYEFLEINEYDTPTSSSFQEYEYTHIDNITDNMVYAWDKTWHSDLFSWANDSFLTVPFRYLTDLFSIPSSSTIIYAFSYWLTISIVWLCFDVLIYVPQLAHRWLDKASME